MERVFGMPAGPLASVLAVLLLVTAGAVTVLAVRNVVLLRMGLRNIPRRRGRTVLITVGLMLGTAIITAALLTGDTMTAAVRASVTDALGATDETVTAGADTELDAVAGVETARAYFDAPTPLAAVDGAATDLPVDGVVAAIVEPVAAQHRAAGRTEPRLTLMAPDPARAPELGLPALTGLAEGAVLLNTDAADELDAAPGDRITVLAGERVVDVEVADVGTWRGLGVDGPAALVGLADAQSLLGRPGQVNHVLVSNRGDDTAGADLTDAVLPALQEAVAPLDLAVHDVKREGLTTADETGNAFVTLFTTFGTFSMAAGVLLIFLIFVMLAAERRSEMGMARAVGTQRRQLVQTFLFEGVAYDLAAAAVGALTGVLVAWVLVLAVARGFAGDDLDLPFTATAQSLIIAYAIGVLLTLVVVTASAWRVSRLNIVSAIRDIPEPAEPRRRRARWIPIALGIVAGILLVVGGASGKQYMPLMLGLSILVISIAPIARAVGAGERTSYTVAGFVLLVLWLLPFDALDPIFGEMSMDFSIWIVGGLLVVLAATWLVTYNADVLLGLASRAAAPFPSLRPIAKMAVAFPLRSRFRTGVTLSMFMLVVFTLVTGSTIPSAFTSSFDDVQRFGGGFDVRVTTAPALAVDDIRTGLTPSLRAQVLAAGSQSFLPVEARQEGTDADWASYSLRGVDDAFAQATTYELAATATGYDTDAEVWRALSDEPGLAVVDPFIAPRRSQWGVGVLPELQLSGFYLEDGTFDPVTLEVDDPLTGERLEVTVIGVLTDSMPFEMAGITVSQELLTPFGDRAVPTVHHLRLRDDVDPDRVARDVEAALLSRGAEAESYQAMLDEAISASELSIRLIQGFMALGLVVGVAALGVISARSVVERRQQIGMLRAIGYQPETIRRGLLAETALIAVTAIVTGTVLGLIISYNVIVDSRGQFGGQDLPFAVPWLELAVIFGSVVLAALLTTVVSALRASRIYPAEALRYQ